MTSPVDLAALDVVLDIAREAGARLLEGFHRGSTVTHKGEIDLVTEHDLASEAIIRARMSAAFPDHGLVAEEGGGDPKHELVWYCDPLDGTTNLSHGHFFFSVSIGLARNGVPVAGVVHAPALDASYVGAVGHGAYRIRRGVRSDMRISTATTLSRSLIATGFPYDRRTSPENNVREMSRIVLLVQGIRRCGSAALDLALVADGTYDGYWEQKLAPWDMCAGAALVVAAGGRLTDYDGAPPSLHAGRVVATNGLVHDELMRELATARA
jgi:myo-inositol-1(or 4)-monophosphatase